MEQLLDELLQFLRALKDVELPVKFQVTRARLVNRVQAVKSSDTQNYIQMKPGKPLAVSSTHNLSEDYIIPDNQTSFLQKYQKSIEDRTSVCSTSTTSSFSPGPQRPPTYLTLDVSPPPVPEPVIVLPPKRPEIADTVEAHDLMIRKYNDMTYFEAENKSDICGQLRRKERRFFFESLRSFWAALVGYHLLTYDDRSDPSPTTIISLKGCKCGPVAGSPRNGRKQLETVFEISFMDNRNSQFTASTIQQMEEWMAAIRRAEANSRDVADVQVQNETSGPDIINEENTLEEGDSNEEYEAVPDIAEILNPQTSLNKSNPAGGQGKPPLRPVPAVKPKIMNHQSTPYPTKRIQRTLPPTPPVETKDDFYNEISESDNRSRDKSTPKTEELDYSIPTEDENDHSADIYYDIDLLKESVKKIEANHVNREPEKKNPTEAIATEETYDDVEMVKKDVEKIRQNGDAIREPTGVDKKLVSESPQQYKSNMKSSPSSLMTGILEKLGLRNNSPQKEEPKMKSPGPTGALKTKEKALEISPEETDSYVNDQVLKDLRSTVYNEPPAPRPVHGESVSNDDSNEVGESIYDDVTMKNVSVDSREINPESMVEKRKKADNFVAGFKKASEGMFGRPATKPKPQRNVIRNLNKSFEDKIYQNQSGADNIEDSCEHYQVPKGETNQQARSSVENDDTEEIYDDAAIAAQKKREVIEAKQTPAAGTPKKNIRGPLMPKPNEKSLINRFNNFALSPSNAKSTPDKKVQNRFIIGKSTRVQETVKPSDNCKIIAGDSEIYDDCQMNGSFKSQVN